MRAAHASVPRKPNTAVWVEVPGLNLVYRCFYQSTKFLPLLLGNHGPQVLDFRSMLSYKDNQRCLGNPGDPRIADELGIERKQARRRFRVSAGCRLPIDEAPHTINFTDRVEVGNELAAARKAAELLYLEILMRVGNSDAIVPSKPFEQMDPLM